MSYDIYYPGECSYRINKNQADSSDITEHPFHVMTSQGYIHLQCVTYGLQRKSVSVFTERGTLQKTCIHVLSVRNVFLSQSGLRQHMNIHRGKYKCTECGRCCGNSQHLARHRRSDSWAFNESENSNTHMRVHAGDKPYKCSLCNKCFSQSSSLQQHKRHVHSNRRPYNCPYCGKLFKVNTGLKRHVRIHTEAKPYSCRHCSDCFRSLDHGDHLKDTRSYWYPM